VKGRFEDSNLLMLFPSVWFDRNARFSGSSRSWKWSHCDILEHR